MFCHCFSPLCFKKMITSRQTSLVKCFFLVIHFSSIGIEAVLILFHGLSELMRGTKARIKKWEQSSVLDEKAGPVGPCASL